MYSKTHPKEVIFKLGDLVQVHRTDLTFTHSNDLKLIPRWSPPFRVALRIRNAYKLQTLNDPKPKESTVHEDFTLSPTRRNTISG